MGTEVGGVPGRRMLVEGEKPRETQRTLHVSELLKKGGNYTGGNGTTARMKYLWGAYISRADDET